MKPKALVLDVASQSIFCCIVVIYNCIILLLLPTCERVTRNPVENQLGARSKKPNERKRKVDKANQQQSQDGKKPRTEPVLRLLDIAYVQISHRTNNLRKKYLDKKNSRIGIY